MDSRLRGSPTLSRIFWWSVVAAVAIYGVAARSAGLGRSLWLDEAWVANSVLAKSLPGMFWYDSWLQTSPPLFLLLVRGTVDLLGLSAFAFRLEPFIFGLIAVSCMFVLARRLLSRRCAIVAWALFVLSHVAIYYSRSLKQYSLELAASTALILACSIYLERPTWRRFWPLLAVVAIGLWMAYPIAFLLPGVLLEVLFAREWTSGTHRKPSRWSGLMRASILGVLAAGTLAVIDLLFVRPNTSPSLHGYFYNARGGRSFLVYSVSVGYKLLTLLSVPYSVLFGGILVYIAFGLVLIGGFLLACIAFRGGERKWLRVQILCGIPCGLLVLCNGLELYPITPRTSLFALPAVVLLLVSDVQSILDFALRNYRRKWLETVMDFTVVCVTGLLMVESIRLSATFMKDDEENVAGAMAFLKSTVQPADILFVHAACREQFKLYAKMMAWNDPPVRFGHTGWACCPRGIPVSVGSGRNEDVKSDLDRAVPGGFSGTVWLLYTARADQWFGVGANQPKMMKDDLLERGCIQQATPVFQNIGVSAFRCASDHVRAENR